MNAMDQIVTKSECTEKRRCRACLKCTEETVFIFNTANIPNELVSYWDILLSICTIEKENKIDLPQHICETCTHKAEAYYEFKLLCENSDKTLQSELTSDEKDDYKIQITEENIKWEDTTDVSNSKNSVASHPNLDYTINDYTENNGGVCTELKRDNYFCNDCGKKFAAKKYLRAHLKRKVCERAKLKRIHNYTQSKQGNDFCNDCGKTFAAEKYLKVHLKNKVCERMKLKRNSCTVCKKEFSNRHTLANHMSNKVCERAMNNYNGFYMNHNDKNVKMFYCKKCKKGFSLRCTVEKHIKRRVCDRTKDSVCGYTVKNFTENDNKNENEPSNPNIVKMYSCKRCSNTFFDINIIEEHVKECKAVFTMSCRFCEETYGNCKGYRKHLIKSHSDKKLGCELCATSFFRPRCLASHMQLKHPGKKVQCKFCDFATNDYTYYVSHIGKKHMHFLRMKSL